jgi:HEAT repeat protein
MEIVDYYVEKARTGDSEAAFHGLRALANSTLPALQDAYRSETDADVRALLVHAIWQHRQPSAIEFLGDALRDPSPEVWKQALDGLVTLASPEAKRVLQVAATRDENKERRDWIAEAIEQVDVFCA